jgi:biopolymer transport protein ExbD
MKHSRRKTYRKLVETELETLPLMGLFVVLIPMLLLSAVFLQITVIPVPLPDDDSAQVDTDTFSLSVRILADRYQVEAKGAPARVIQRSDQALTTLSEELMAVVAQHPGQQAVTIISESHTRYEDLIAVMDITREAGLPQIALAGEGS